MPKNRTKNSPRPVVEEPYIKDFLDMVAPSVIDFKVDHYLCGNTCRCVWALREYPTSTDEQAILRHLGEMDGVTIRIYTRQVTPSEERRIIHNAANKHRMSRSSTEDLQQTVTAEANLQDVVTLVSSMHRNREPLLHCAVFLELTAPDYDTLKLLQTDVLTELVRSKLNVDRLMLRQQEGFVSVMPAGRNAFGAQFERVLPASSVANLYPFNYSGKTDPHGFYIGKDKYGANTQGKSYRGNIEGSDPRCSFHWVGTSDRLYVFEAPIDLLAFLTLYPDGWQQHSYVALCGTAEHAMLWMLEKNPNLRKTILCLDHDAAGIEAVGRLSDVLREHGYSQIAPLQSEYKDWDEDLKARHGLEAQPAEEHPQFVAADLVCQRIGTRCKEVQPDRAAYQIPGLLLQYRNDLHWGRFDQAMEHMETMAALSLSVVLRECKQMGTALTVEQGVRFLESHILPHQNRSILKNRADEIAMQFQSVLAKNNRQGIRTQAEKKEVASAWLELAISCAKVPVKYEADEIKRRQKEEKTQRETEPVMA